jgi:hypothetical protein
LPSCATASSSRAKEKEMPFILCSGDGNDHN